MQMPKDPVMLLSFVNMKLRDFYQDMESLCMDYNITMDAVSEKLHSIGYTYDRALNQYVSQQD